MIFHKIVPGKCVWQFHICGFFFSEGVVRVGWSRAKSRARINLFVFFWRGLPTKKVTSITSYSYCTVDYICLCYLVTAVLWMLPIPARLQRLMLQVAKVFATNVASTSWTRWRGFESWRESTRLHRAAHCPPRHHAAHCPPCMILDVSCLQ